MDNNLKKVSQEQRKALGDNVLITIITCVRNNEEYELEKNTGTYHNLLNMMIKFGIIEKASFRHKECKKYIKELIREVVLLPKDSFNYIFYYLNK